MSDVNKIKERGQIYRQLVEFMPFRYFVEEMQNKEQSLKDGIAECLTPGDDKLYDKGTRAGIRLAIEIPEEAIKELEGLEQNKENS
jgi:hypothetical protein